MIVRKQRSQWYQNETERLVFFLLRIESFFERFRVQIVIFFSSFFEAAKGLYISCVDRQSFRYQEPLWFATVNLTRTWNFDVHKLGEIDVVQKKCWKCRNKRFAAEVLKYCRIYSLSSRMRDVKAVYPTPSKACFRVSDNQSNCIFTCKAHQGSTLSKKIFRLRCSKFYDCHSLLITYPTFSESATFCLEYNHMPRMKQVLRSCRGAPRLASFTFL